MTTKTPRPLPERRRARLIMAATAVACGLLNVPVADAQMLVPGPTDPTGWNEAAREARVQFYADRLDDGATVETIAEELREIEITLRNTCDGVGDATATGAAILCMALNPKTPAFAIVCGWGTRQVMRSFCRSTLKSVRKRNRELVRELGDRDHADPADAADDAEPERPRRTSETDRADRSPLLSTTARGTRNVHRPDERALRGVSYDRTTKAHVRAERDRARRNGVLGRIMRELGNLTPTLAPAPGIRGTVSAYPEPPTTTPARPTPPPPAPPPMAPAPEPSDSGPILPPRL